MKVRTDSKSIINYLLCLLLVSGWLQISSCSSNAVNYSTPANTELGLKVTRVAQNMLGKPYHYGGATPQGFDCSGLVFYSYTQAGAKVPRTTITQYQQAYPIELDKLQPGDLIFFRLGSQTVSHVGIYQGDGRFIHAPKTGKHVSLDSINSQFWKARLVGGGRFSS